MPGIRQKSKSIGYALSSFKEEIIAASRRKYSIPKCDAAKLIAEEEATIIRSEEEKAIIEGRAKRKARERGEVEETEPASAESSGGAKEEKTKTSQEAEPMI